MLKIFLQELWQALRQELRGSGRLNKTAVVLLILMPLCYTVLFGATYSANVLNNIPLAVCDLQQSKISRMLIKYYDTSDRFLVMEQVASMEQLEDALTEGRAKVGLYIPPDLDSKIKRGIPTEVGLLIDSTNVVYGSASVIAAKEINLNLLIGGGQKIVERLGLYPDEAISTMYPALIRVRILKNPTNSYTNFMLLGLIGNGVQISLYLYGAAAFAKGRQWRRYPGAVLLGKALGMGLYSLLGFVGSLLLAHQLFAVPLRASWAALLLLGGSFIILFILVSLLFALAFPNAVLAIQNTLLFIMPGLLYSGLSWPDEWMGRLPSFIQIFFPITYLAVPLRDLSLMGSSGLLMHNVMNMLAMAGALFLLDYLLLVNRYRGESCL